MDVVHERVTTQCQVQNPAAWLEGAKAEACPREACCAT